MPERFSGMARHDERVVRVKCPWVHHDRGMTPLLKSARLLPQIAPRYPKKHPKITFRSFGTRSGISFWWVSLEASFIALAVYVALHEAGTAIHLEKDSTVSSRPTVLRFPPIGVRPNSPSQMTRVSSTIPRSLRSKTRAALA